MTLFHRCENEVSVVVVVVVVICAICAGYSLCKSFVAKLFFSKRNFNIFLAPQYGFYFTQPNSQAFSLAPLSTQSLGNSWQENA